MKLKDALKIYYERSTKLSDVVRQLNFAGIAVIWLFRTGDKTGGIPYSECLLWPLGLLIGSATFDLLHYAYASAAWGIFHRVKKKKISKANFMRLSQSTGFPLSFFGEKQFSASLLIAS